MDLEHKLQMNTLGQDDIESLTFDLDISRQETMLLQRKFDQLSEQL